MSRQRNKIISAIHRNLLIYNRYSLKSFINILFFSLLKSLVIAVNAISLHSDLEACNLLFFNH
ncbi:MAG: hypothetical protein CSB06_02520 [Bacteroidia bacterium]|nr:MAG: hypothetical protein CSB06_02520 [Bacteroidia bacterium]